MASDTPAWGTGAGQVLVGAWGDLPHPTTGTRAQGELGTHRQSAEPTEHGGGEPETPLRRRSPFGGARQD